MSPQCRYDQAVCCTRVETQTAISEQATPLPMTGSETAWHTKASSVPLNSLDTPALPLTQRAFTPAHRFARLLVAADVQIFDHRLTFRTFSSPLWISDTVGYVLSGYSCGTDIEPSSRRARHPSWTGPAGAPPSCRPLRVRTALHAGRSLVQFRRGGARQQGSGGRRRAPSLGICESVRACDTTLSASEIRIVAPMIVLSPLCVRKQTHPKGVSASDRESLTDRCQCSTTQLRHTAAEHKNPASRLQPGGPDSMDNLR